MTNNIISCWLAIRGGTKAAAVRWLNIQTGMMYSQSRVLDWEKNRLPVPTEVRKLILPEVLPSILMEHGVKPTQELIDAVMSVAVK